MSSRVSTQRAFRVEQDLNDLFPAKWLYEQAEATGFMQRYRKVDPVLMFWTVVLGFGVRMQRSLAGLHRAYQRNAEPENDVNRSSFYKRFDDRLVVFLKTCVRHAIEHQAGEAGQAMGKRFERFHDVLVQDSTVIRLHESLAKAFPATRSRVAAAGVKVNLLVSAVSGGAKRVLITGERTAEAKLLKIGAWVKDRILLIDLGYYKHHAFARIQENGGYYVSRLKGSADPTIVGLVRKVRGASINVEGKRVSEVLPKLKRGVLDCIVEVSFKRRAYNGKSTPDTLRMRLVAVRNEETGEYHAYITNIMPDVLEAEDIASLYAVRWDIELVFKELKSRYALDVINTRDPQIVEALIWIAILTLLVSRRVYNHALRRSDPSKFVRYTKQRWSIVFAENAQELRNRVLMTAGVSWDFMDFDEIYNVQGLDPNINRERLHDVLW